MTKKITIAIDAMGGENSPKKNIKGLGLFLEKNKDNPVFYVQYSVARINSLFRILNKTLDDKIILKPSWYQN